MKKILVADDKARGARTGPDRLENSGYDVLKRAMARRPWSRRGSSGPT